MSFSLTALATRRSAAFADSRRRRAAQQRLRAELASYRTPAERAELDAILSRHTEQEHELLAERVGSWSAAA
jgi:hypothetical protein